MVENKSIYPSIPHLDDESESSSSSSSPSSRVSVNNSSSYISQVTRNPISQQVSEVSNEHSEELTSTSVVGTDDPRMNEPETSDATIDIDLGKDNCNKISSDSEPKKQGRYFCYEPPHYEETGAWIPVSVPPMMESGHECYGTVGGYIPEGDMGWSQCVGEDKELTMWDVVLEMLLVVQGKVKALASGDIHGCTISWLSGHILEQAWKEMAETLAQADFGKILEILEAVPPKWLPDSSSPSCMLCSVRFHALMCSRHHCRFCGGIFCGECSKGRSLLPVKFRTEDPERVCDVCCSMEDEIYKASNTILGYSKVGLLKPERSIPRAILCQAKGLAIISVVKVGVMVTYNIGTGLVIARREDGSWSLPSAISSFGVGWGAQVS
ncbi:hypothetical protein C5167_008649 [Papaver somniferum]|uniref:FYVE-type domain-containing protein n=1 Tax=Papaver somniferum TaxID=3469 RepID=A0A4Y7JY40_PAPSO|nr:hypothetical protein C5167_008649 [Papaver somniferum]